MSDIQPRNMGINADIITCSQFINNRVVDKLSRNIANIALEHTQRWDKFPAITFLIEIFCNS